MGWLDALVRHAIELVGHQPHTDVDTYNGKFLQWSAPRYLYSGVNAWVLAKDKELTECGFLVKWWVDGSLADIQCRIIAEKGTMPFDPHWSSCDVVDLCKAIKEDEAYDRCPILADALQDAGCDHPILIKTLRGTNQRLLKMAVDYVIREGK